MVVVRAEGRTAGTRRKMRKLTRARKGSMAKADDDDGMGRGGGEEEEEEEDWMDEANLFHRPTPQMTCNAPTHTH